MNSLGKTNRFGKANLKDNAAYEVLFSDSHFPFLHPTFTPMKDILARMYFVYGMLLFAITMLPVALLFWVVRHTCNERKASILIQKGFQVWMGMYMPLIFCPVRHKGREYFKPGKNYVVTLNHNTLADVPVSSPGIPGPNRTLAKVEMSKIPIFGYIYKSGSILVSRQDAKSRKDSIPQMIEALKHGLHLCLFPEGTRNKTDQPLARFMMELLRWPLRRKSRLYLDSYSAPKTFFILPKKCGPGRIKSKCIFCPKSQQKACNRRMPID